METILSCKTHRVIIGDGRPTVIIGERINPSGKKEMSNALKQGKFEDIRREATAQIQAGADVLDINVGIAGVDEIELLPKVTRIATDAAGIPLCLDSTNTKALAAALNIYEGKALINSVTGEEKSLKSVLPLVKGYGAAVIGLIQDDDGIPDTLDKRISIAHKIVDRAVAAGILLEDIIIDCLATSVGVDTGSALLVLETIQRIKTEIGVNLTLGASNVSFGLPDRDVINRAFAVVAIRAGLTSMIADAAKLRPIVLAADLLMDHDSYSQRYINACRKRLG